MLSPSKVQYSRVASQHTNKVRLVKGDQPLMNFRFYLDVQNHLELNNIEKYIKKLGGSIEFLLSRKITHLVTDKQLQTDGTKATTNLEDPKQSPSPFGTPGTPYSTASGQLSISSTDVGSPHYAGENSNEAKTSASHFRTRASAMLQLARSKQQPNETTTSSYRSYSKAQQHQPTVNCESQGPSLQEALCWGIPVWTPQRALTELKRIYQLLANTAGKYTSTPQGGGGPASGRSQLQKKRLTASESAPAARPTQLRGHFIKLEAADRRYRPYSSLLQGWPIIDLGSEDKAGAFVSQGTTKNNNNNNNHKTNLNNHMMTRKGRGSKVGSAKTPTAPKQVAATKKPVTNDSRISKEATTTTATSAQCTTSSSSGADPKIERGFCEICRIEYEALPAHLKTAKHINFARNDDNFLALDKLINNEKSNVNTFLKKNSLDKSPTTKTAPNKQLNRQSPTTPVRNGDANLSNGGESAETELFGKRSLFGRRLGSKVEAAKDQKTDPQQHNDIQNTFTLNGRKRTCRSMHPSSEEPLPSIEQQKQQQRARRESAKQVNYAEPQEDGENGPKSEDEKSALDGVASNNILSKIRARGIQWRPPPTSANSPNIPAAAQPCLYKVIERDQKRKITPPPTPKIVPPPSPTAIEEFCEDEAETTNKSKNAPTFKVKLKRVRQSELSVLSDEAVNFMFPKRSNSDTDEDRHTTSEPAENSIDLISSEADRKLPYIKTEPIDHDNSDDSDNCAPSAAATRSGRKASERRRRGNHMEAFLNDNSEYYKFGTPGSRLRFRDAPIQPTLENTSTQSPVIKQEKCSATITAPKCSAVNATADVTKTTGTGVEGDKALEDGMGELRKLKEVLASEAIQRLKFSFERVPAAEPWFEAFQRQDESRERIFEYYGSTAYRKLPYEMGPLPALPADCCFLAKLLGDSGQQSRAGAKRNNRRKKLASQQDVNKEEEILERNVESFNGIQSKLQLSSSSSIPTTATSSTSMVTDKKDEKAVTRSSEAASRKLTGAERRKKKLLLEMAYPRKSPREHASTLAILSCLVQQRKKRERELTSSPSSKNMQSMATKTPGEMDKETEFGNNGAGKESDNPYAIPEDDYVDVHRLSREVDEMLITSNDFETSDLDTVIIDESECVDLCRSSEVRLDECLQSIELDDGLHTLTDPRKLEPRTSEMLSVGRLNATKKRKNNRTGWPTATKKRRLAQHSQRSTSSTMPRSSIAARSTEDDDELDEDAEDDDDDDEAARRPSYNPAFVEDDDESSALSPTAAAHNGVIDVSSQLEGEEFILSQRVHDHDEDDDEEEEEVEEEEELVEEDNDDDEVATCPSSSEKEDIFNVSSDSLDTASTELDVSKLDDELTATVVIRGELKPVQRSNRGSGRYRKKCSAALNARKRKVLNRNARQKKSSLLALPSSSPSSTNVVGMRQSPQLSPRKLRKPRGCWYRER